MSGADTTADPEAVRALREAAADLESVEADIAETGSGVVDRVTEAYREATALLEEYEDRATGTGGENFQAYVKFQEEFTSHVEGLPEDLRHRDAFEAALERVDKRRLNESDFAAAREALAPAGRVASLVEERERARERYNEARQEAARRKAAVAERVDELERLVELGDADLDAPVEELREPVAAYDEGVREAFARFKRGESARTVLAFVAETEAYPLAGFRSPPEDLHSFVESSPDGTETIPDLLEYADYSRSKLDHYVDDAVALKRNVATRGTYLERLDAEPLTVGWPPPPADELRWTAREYVALVGRFADEDVLATLHEVRDLARDDEWYARLRDAAVARERVDDAERERLASGAVERDLEEARAALAALEDALAEYPKR